MPTKAPTMRKFTLRAYLCETLLPICNFADVLIPPILTANYGFNTNSGICKPDSTAAFHEDDGRQSLGNSYSNFSRRDRSRFAHRSDLRSGRSIQHSSFQSG